MGFFTGSSNYRMDNPLVSTQGNIVFDSNESMPKEIMLKTTLKAFGFNVDILEVNLFVLNGFGKDGNTFSKVFSPHFSRLVLKEMDLNQVLKPCLGKEVSFLILLPRPFTGPMKTFQAH